MTYWEKLSCMIYPLLQRCIAHDILHTYTITIAAARIGSLWLGGKEGFYWWCLSSSLLNIVNLLPMIHLWHFLIVLTLLHWQVAVIKCLCSIVKYDVNVNFRNVIYITGSLQSSWFLANTNDSVWVMYVFHSYR